MDNKKIPTFWYLVIGIVVVIIGAFAWYFWGQVPSAPAASPPPAYSGSQGTQNGYVPPSPSSGAQSYPDANDSYNATSTESTSTKKK